MKSLINNTNCNFILNAGSLYLYLHRSYCSIYLVSPKPVHSPIKIKHKKLPGCFTGRQVIMPISSRAGKRQTEKYSARKNLPVPVMFYRLGTWIKVTNLT